MYQESPGATPASVGLGALCVSASCSFVVNGSERWLLAGLTASALKENQVLRKESLWPWSHTHLLWTEDWVGPDAGESRRIPSRRREGLRADKSPISCASRQACPPGWPVFGRRQGEEEGRQGSTSGVYSSSPSSFCWWSGEPCGDGRKHSCSHWVLFKHPHSWEDELVMGASGAEGSSQTPSHINSRNGFLHGFRNDGRGFSWG